MILVLYLPRLRFPIDKNELADYAKNLGGEAGNLLLLILEKISDPNKIYSSDVLKQDIVQTINNDPDLSILNKHFGQIIGCTLFMPYKGDLRIGIREASEIEMRKEKEQSQPSQRQSQQPQAQPREGLDKKIEDVHVDSGIIEQVPESLEKIPGLDKKIKLLESTLSTVRIRLPGIEFPTNKEKIIQHAVMANQDSIINILENIPDRVYENPVDFEMEKTLRDPNRKITVVKFFPELNKNLRLKRAIGRVIVDTRDIRQDEREQLLQQQEQQLSS